MAEVVDEVGPGDVGLCGGRLSLHSCLDCPSPVTAKKSLAVRSRETGGNDIAGPRKRKVAGTGARQSAADGL